jgi:RNA polymerase sigma-70 factor (family 1)
MSQIISKDLELLQQLLKDNQVAFESIYSTYSSMLFNYAYSRVRDKAVCEEMIQEVFISLWEKRKNLGHITALKPYLFAAVRYKIVDHIAHSVVREKYVQHYLLHEARYDNSLEEQTNVADFFPQLERYIAGLPENCQRAFKLSRMNHMPIPEIAAQMNLSTGTVENYISQALRHLRNVLIP